MEALIILILLVFFKWQNDGIVISNYEYKNSKIPQKFNNYKIVQISDFHNKNYKGKLSKKIKNIKPDIIVITGDIIDRRKVRLNLVTDFIKEIKDIAPIYYVSGNHEFLSGTYNEVKELLERKNVKILDNSFIVIEKEKDRIGLMGVEDPTSRRNPKHYTSKNNREYMKKSIEKLSKLRNTDFTILLAHRPEQFKLYVEEKFDLVFTGHAHGGQIRLPFIGGLFSPNQGIFPKYTCGIYKEDETSMLVSRGLGGSAFPFRLFNRPDLVVLTLKSCNI
ncbi:metallophosphoesterase [Caproiciproducens sp. MSJ-32]|nr:metallophosphoesterase [Caproiciproducens sp. MSJ-32]